MAEAILSAYETLKMTQSQCNIPYTISEIAFLPPLSNQGSLLHSDALKEFGIHNRPH